MNWRRVSLLIFNLAIAFEAEANCELSQLSWVDSSNWGSCFQTEIGIYGLGIADRNSNRLAAGAWNETYASGFLRPWLSLHGKAYALSNYQTLEERERHQERTTEQLFLQLGRPLQSSVHGAIGRIPLPFGINDENYRFLLPQNKLPFWDRSVSGLRVSLRLRDDLRLEAGGAWDKPSELRSQSQDALSFRMIKLVDLLSGTKLIASYQNKSDNSSNKIGLGTLVYNDENLTTLEWVRLTSRAQPADFEQIFRFIHRQVAKPWAWDFQYEDVRKRSYRLGLGFHRQLLEQRTGSLVASGSIHYERLREAKPLHHTYVAIGLSYDWSASVVGGEEALHAPPQ